MMVDEVIRTGWMGRCTTNVYCFKKGYNVIGFQGEWWCMRGVSGTSTTNQQPKHDGCACA